MSKVIKIGKTPPPKKNQCPVRPPLDGSKGNPMSWRQYKNKNKGPHSWEIKS